MLVLKLHQKMKALKGFLIKLLLVIFGRKAFYCLISIGMELFGSMKKSPRLHMFSLTPSLSLSSKKYYSILTIFEEVCFW